MPGPLFDFFQADHARLDELLTRAAAGPSIDLEVYGVFREGLLRHIAMEEKIVIPEARSRSRDVVALAARLRADHSALAALLVPTPTHGLIAKIREVLAEHNPLEEEPGGLYELCERLVGDDVGAICARVRATPSVPVAAYFDGTRVFASIDKLLRARVTQSGR